MSIEALAIVCVIGMWIIYDRIEKANRDVNNVNRKVVELTERLERWPK